MTKLSAVLGRHVGDGGLPGAVALVARGRTVEAAAVGFADVERGIAMERPAVFRWASITKPVTAAAGVLLADEGLLGLDDPVGEWLPELAGARVAASPEAAVDDLVPLVRPITLRHLLESRSGWGFPADFSLPAVQRIFEEFPYDPRLPQQYPPPAEWLARLARVPMLHQPGDQWLYNASYDLLGVLVARVAGRTLGEFMAERIFEPLGMADTGFRVPPAALPRMTTYYTATDDGLRVSDPADGEWTGRPAFEPGSSGLAGTADDWLAFARMLLAGGLAPDGRRILSEASVRAMTTDHLTEPERRSGELFLEGQGWGYGGSVDVVRRDPWNVPGRYGWVGGTGTSAHLVPSTGTVALLFTQLAAENPVPDPHFRDFWTYAAG